MFWHRAQLYSFHRVALSVVSFPLHGVVHGRVLAGNVSFIHSNDHLLLVTQPCYPSDTRWRQKLKSSVNSSKTLDTWANPPNGQVFWTRKNGGVAFIWFTFYISLNITMVTISTIHYSCIYCFSSSFSWIISLIILRNERGWIWRILIKVNPCVCGEQWNFNRLEGDVTREGWFGKTTLHCDICEGYYLGLGRSSKQDPLFWYFLVPMFGFIMFYPIFFLSESFPMNVICFWC